MKVNGTAVKEAFLRANDEIILGEYRIRYFEDSAARNMVTYGTPELPPNFAKVMAESAYSGSFLPSQSVGSAMASPAERSASAQDRVNALEQENRLLTLLYRVNRALSEVTAADDVARRILDLVLEMDGAERGFIMLLDRDSIGRGDFSKGGYGFEPALIRYRAGSKASPGQGAPQLTISQSIIRQVMHGGLAAARLRPAGRSAPRREPEHRHFWNSVRDVRAAGNRRQAPRSALRGQSLAPRHVHGGRSECVHGDRARRQGSQLIAHARKKNQPSSHSPRQPLK